VWVVLPLLLPHPERGDLAPARDKARRANLSGEGQPTGQPRTGKEKAMFSHPDRIGQLARENHRQMLAQASQRQLLHDDDRPAARTPGPVARMTRRLAAAFIRADVATAPAAGRSQ
jgi:hypothetical protein